MGRPKKISNEDLKKQMDSNGQGTKIIIPVGNKNISKEDLELALDKLASSWKEASWKYEEQSGNKGILLFCHRYFRHPATGNWTKSKVRDEVGELSPVDRYVWITMAQNNASVLEYANQFFTHPS